MRCKLVSLSILCLLLFQLVILQGGDEASAGTSEDLSVFGTRSISGYRNYTETVQIMKNLETSYPSLVKLYDLGKRYPYFNNTPKQTRFNNSIWALKITDKIDQYENDEPAVLYLGLHHAREWITVEVCLYMANYLTSKYSTNSTVRSMVDQNELWIVPILNPDGYIYSHALDDINKSSGSGGWRKNRVETNGVGGFQDYGGASGDGVDLNRNYGYQWGYDNTGSDPSPNGATYRGSSAFSEIETQLIRDLSLDRQFATAVSFHSFSEIIIFPWAYRDADTYHHKLFVEMGSEMAKYNGYQYGNPKSGIIYNTNGEFTDWMYNQIGTLAFTFELGLVFIPPTNEIASIASENAEAAFVAAKYAKNPFALFESKLDGTVKTTMGVPIEGAEIEPVYVNYTLKAISGQDGKYSIRLPDGSYTVRVKRTGFASAEFKNVVVPPGGKVALDITLKDIVPPKVKEVRGAHVLAGDENDTVFNANEEIVIIARAENNETGLSGYFTVNSSSQKYLSPKNTLTYSQLINGYYGYWPTSGLNQSEDYHIDAVLEDHDGNADINGSNELGPDLVISLLDVTPPVVSAVRSSAGALIGGIYETGLPIRIDVSEENREKGLSGTVIIFEESRGYSTGSFPLLFDPIKNCYFWEWNTSGIPPSNEFSVETTLADKWGNTDLDGLSAFPDITIALVDTTAPFITAMDSFVIDDHDEEYEIGSNVTLIVYEVNSEPGLNGYATVYSPDVEDSKELNLPLQFDYINDYYFTHWDTNNAVPFVDYYIDSALNDDYGNDDIDGSNSFGPDIIIQLTDTRPPEIARVFAVANASITSSAEGGSANGPIQYAIADTFELGSTVRIIVEPNEFELNLTGIVLISSKTTGYRSPDLILRFDETFDHYYAPWSTVGLEIASDYIVETNLSDKYGNTDDDGLFAAAPDLVLALKDSMPPVVTSVSIGYPDDPETGLDWIEYGRSVQIRVTIAEAEYNVNAHFRITSNLSAYDTGELSLQPDPSTHIYVTNWSTGGLRLGADYELEAVFSDRFGNADVDGWRSGPDLLFAIRDTVLPSSVQGLSAVEDQTELGVVVLKWASVEPNATVVIYRSEDESFSLSSASVITTIGSNETYYRDPVGLTGRTYYYVLILTDEHGNINDTVSDGNSASVKVSRATQNARTTNTTPLIISAIVVIVIVIIILFFIFGRRKSKVPISDKRITNKKV